MDINRNQFFMLGLVILAVGLQLRMVNSYLLTPEATKFLAEQWPAEEEEEEEKPVTEATPEMIVQASAAGLPQVKPQQKTIAPPQWLGWALVSIGSVLILHALALRAPG